MFWYWASRHKAISFNIFFLFLPIETYRINKIIVYVSPHIDLAGPSNEFLLYIEEEFPCGSHTEPMTCCKVTHKMCCYYIYFDAVSVNVMVYLMRIEIKGDTRPTKFRKSKEEEEEKK